MADDIDISPVVALSESDAPQIEALLPQLSSTATFDLDRLRRLIAAPDSQLFLAREQDRIVGMATLVTFPLVTGWRGIVEDVVVDRRVRGRGIAASCSQRSSTSQRDGGSARSTSPLALSASPRFACTSHWGSSVEKPRLCGGYRLQRDAAHSVSVCATAVSDGCARACLCAHHRSSATNGAGLRARTLPVQLSEVRQRSLDRCVPADDAHPAGAMPTP